MEKQSSPVNVNKGVGSHVDEVDDAATQLKAPPATFLLPLNVAFYLCVTSHVLAALYAPIQDCDETFNYWEPLHYLTHGYGLQTWEYSPEYSIRSWAYILLHAIPTKLVSLLGKSKTFEFYFLRVLLAVVCAATEIRLYSAICRTLNRVVGVFYLMIVAFTPGFFYASAAFLPSSFAMYTSTLGLTAFIDHREGGKTAQGIMWFGIGAMLGWPFAGALIVPFVLDDWAIAASTRNIATTVRRYLDGACRCLVVLCIQTAVDSIFYRKVVFVPWRIVSYNVFSSGDRGPDIFGTEPWDFYIRNLVLNFNAWFVLAIIVAPLLAFYPMISQQPISKQPFARLATLVAPFYLWFAIFTSQPHKEERFMFPAYPFLALSAAVAMHLILVVFGNLQPRTLIGKIPAQLKLAIALFSVLFAVNIGLLRILGVVTAYRAPLQIYESLSSQTNITSTDTICIGKEWYRFPSSFFLPNSSHAKFVKSAFGGLLPGEFIESRGTTDFLPGTWLVPSGMNDRNQEDPGKYTDVRECTHIVDTRMPSLRPSSLEPDYTSSRDWEVIACADFLDASSTHFLARTIWLPDLPIVPQRYRRVWGQYCALRRTSPVRESV